jgi:hypothetical protein
MKKISLGNIDVFMSQQAADVIITTNGENIILPNQEINLIEQTLITNFNIITSHFNSALNKTKEEIPKEGLVALSVEILLYYLYMYNLWRGIYKNQENRSLTFEEKDFANSSTYDIIFRHLKTLCPNNWIEKSAGLLNLDINEVKEIYKNRELFYNK